MTNDEIMKAAYDLGTMLGDTEGFAQMKILQGRLQVDAKAANLIAQYENARMALEQKEEVTDADKERITALEQEIDNNELLKEITRVQMEVQNLMQGVYNTINQAISASQFDEESCAGSCGSCGCDCSGGC